jgi:NAD-dependent dihydropyrimidine dehydrogenase PreA subunit
MDLPYLEVDQRPCVLCAKCTQECPTGALERLPASLPELQARVKMGTPRLRRGRCLSWRGEGVCRLCFEVCPYAGSAIVLVGIQQAPLFDPAKCVGCGQCAEACPSLARAIHILPPGGPA